MRRFENKSVPITGAASGMGRAAAHRFAQEGASITGVVLPVDGGISASNGQPRQ